MGWLHPALDAIENGQMAFRRDPQDDKIKGMITTEMDMNSFQKLIQRVRDQCKSGSFSETKFEQARLISAIAGDDLLPDTTIKDARSAELFHNFEEIASPVYMGNCKFMFMRMWQIPSLPAEARHMLEAKPITPENQQVQIYWDARLGPKTKKTFLLSSLVFDVPTEISADEFFETIKQDRDSYLDKLAAHIRSLWKDAKFNTEFFWREEVGFRIGDEGFRGTPWVKFLK